MRELQPSPYDGAHEAVPGKLITALEAQLELNNSDELFSTIPSRSTRNRL